MDTLLRKLQDEAASLEARFNDLTAIEVEAGSEQAKQANDELETIATRADQIKKEIEARTSINSKIASMKSAVGDSEPRGVIAPAPVSAPAEVRQWDGKGEMPEEVAQRCGLMLRAIARGEARGAFTSATEEPNSHGERLPTYLGRNSELVFEEFYRSILGILSYTSIAMQVAMRLTTTSNRITVPRADENVEAELYLENCEIKPVMIKTSSTTINVEKLGARAQVSNELLEDAFVSVPQLVATKFAYAFAKKIDQLWLEGDATAGITGLLSQITNEVTVAPKITIGNLSDLVSKINPYAVNPVWIMSPAGLGQLQSAAAGTIGYDVSAPMRMQIFGAPVYKCLSLPDDVLGIYGDFKQASMVVDRSNGLTINASRERAIEYDQTVFVGTQRFGIASTGPSFVAALKK